MRFSNLRISSRSIVLVDSNVADLLLMMKDKVKRIYWRLEDFIGQEK